MSSSPQFNPSESPNYGYTVPSMPSPNLRAFLEYIDAQSTWDLDRILNCFDDALEHRILPLSLGRPVLNKRQYGEYMRGVRPLFKSGFDLTLHEVIEADNSIISHLSSKSESVSGRPYANEYIIIIHFTPPPPSASPSTLPKIRLVKEYVDSSYSTKFFAEERAKAKERLENAGGK